MNDWMNNPKLANMDPSKLALLSSLASQGVNKNKSELLPFFLSAMSTAKSNGIDFQGEEQQLLFDVLLQQLSPEEKRKAENIIKMTSAFRK